MSNTWPAAAHTSTVSTVCTTCCVRADTHRPLYYRVPAQHRENRENGPKNPCQGKGREFGNFAKAQGILFAQDVNSLILKVKDIAIFAAKNFHFLYKLDMSAKSVLCV